MRTFQRLSRDQMVRNRQDPAHGSACAGTALSPTNAIAIDHGFRESDIRELAQDLVLA
jgi:hypothetical protein